MQIKFHAHEGIAPWKQNNVNTIYYYKIVTMYVIMKVATAEI